MTNRVPRIIFISHYPKNICLWLILLLVWPGFVKGQQLEWMQKAVSSKYPLIKADITDAVADKNGNVLFYGKYSGNHAYVGSWHLKSYENDSTNLFYGFIDSAGRVKWINTIGNNRWQYDYPSNIFIDAHGYFYITARISSRTKIEGALNEIKSKETVVAFIKCNQDGRISWVKYLNEKGAIEVKKYTVSPDGSYSFIFRVASSSGIIKIDNVQLNVAGLGGGILTHFDSSGKLQWIKTEHVYQGFDHSEFGTSILSSNSKGEIFTIAYKNKIHNTFTIYKYSKAGNVIDSVIVKAMQDKSWYTRSNLQIDETTDDLYLIVDADGQLEINNKIIDSYGSYALYIVKFNKNLDLIWHKRFERPSSRSIGSPKMKVAPEGNIFLSLHFPEWIRTNDFF